MRVLRDKEKIRILILGIRILWGFGRLQIDRQTARHFTAGYQVYMYQSIRFHVSFQAAFFLSGKSFFAEKKI
jgi:hypothetical protein